MRIAFLTDSFLPYVSGVSQSVYRFATGLSLNEHEVQVFAPRYQQILPKTYLFEVARYPAKTLKNYNGFGMTWPFDRSLDQKLFEFKPQVIHVHSPFQMGLKALFFKKVLKVPMVFTLHTLFDEYLHFVPLIPQKLSWKILKIYLSWFCQQCDLIIAPTQEAAAKVKKDYNIRKPLKILPTGVFVLPRALNASEPPFDEKHFNCLYVGRISPEKNIDFLLEIFMELIKNHPQIRLYFIGGFSKNNNYLQKVLEKGYREKIIFIGEIPYENLAPFYQKADVLVSTSKTETQGLIFIEAGSEGLPVVALESQGAKNVIKNDVNGFLVSENKLEFSQAILRFKNDPELRQRVRISAKEFIKKNFDQLKLSQKLFELYQSLA
jgi:glycosyltransferase involved in cell wall biosynthesis